MYLQSINPGALKVFAILLLSGIAALAGTLLLIHRAQGAEVRPPAGPFNFIVEIDGIQSAFFKSVEGLASETEIVEVREGGSNITRKVPGRTKYSNIVLKRGYNPADDLWQWRQNIVRGQVDRRAGAVVILDSANQQVGRYCFSNAWPAAWRTPKLVSRGQSSINEEIELAVEGIERC